MLQQTRSRTVEAYYGRFLERFPTLETLAAASESEVLAQWSGLGYYRRARQLHAAVKLLAEEGRSVPETLEGLLELPGVGSYTAAAVGSIAFGIPEPVVDGNVERVLSRYHALELPTRTADGKRRLRELAGELMDPRRPGDLNQALMELGALVCTPRSPRCDACPLARDCDARAADAVEAYPLLEPRRETIDEDWLAVVVQNGGRVLLARRPTSSSLLAGMLEVPWVQMRSGSGADPEADLAATYGGDWRIGSSLGQVRHQITHRRLDVEVRRAEWSATELAEQGSMTWLGREELSRHPTTALVGKILDLESL